MSDTITSCKNCGVVLNASFLGQKIRRLPYDKKIEEWDSVKKKYIKGIKCPVCKTPVFIYGA